MPRPDIDPLRVAEIFGRAAELAPEQRPAFLDGECAREPGLRTEVESLLEADRAAGGYLEDLDVAHVGTLIDQHGDAERGTVGPYRLVRVLGRGGMGVVYLAERDDDAYHKQVAVKLARAGWLSGETLRRFRTERQVLATLEHPNIARLLDGGTTEDDVPYVVMEYVDGTPIDEHCEQQDLGTTQRLDLFLAVCGAVAHAHRHLVVHRDLKPSNVLVDHDGTPKLLDFGIAKLLDPTALELTVVETQELHRPMTPAYASPEQVRGGAVTISTDVYSLGALLYRLLAGRPPLEVSGRSPAEIERLVCEKEPEPPASGSRDLDTIVLKALRKEPTARYASVGELADDLRRYLAGLAVLARPATLGYRTGKFLRRHRIGAALTLTAATILATTSGFYTWRLSAERDRARAEAAKALQVTELLVGLFRGSSPSGGSSREVTAREVLDQGARRLEGELSDQPELRAELLHTIARVYLELDMLTEAEALARRALAARTELFGDSGPQVADSQEVLARVKTAQAEYDDARSLLEHALEIRSRRFGADSKEYAEALYALALVEFRGSHDNEARDLLERVLAIRERLYGSEHRDVADVLNFLGILARRLDEPEKAEAYYRRSISIHERTLGPDHPSIANTLNNLGVLLSRTGRLEEARATYERALAIHERTYGPEHDLVAGTLDNLGETLKNLGRAEEALPLVQRAAAYREEHYGPNHQATGTTLNTLANLYRELGRYDEAIPLYQRSIAATEAGLGADHFWVAWPLANLGKLYLLRSETERARPLFARSLELRRNALGPSHSLVAASFEDLAQLAEAERDLPGAIELYRQALQIRRALPGGQTDQLATTLRALAGALAASGAAAEAEALLREASEVADRRASSAAP